MPTSTVRAKLAKVAAVAAIAATSATTLIAAGSNAGADPAQFEALNIMGSDTTQDVLNALSGYSNGINYTPLQSTTSLLSGQKLQVTSWNATPLPDDSDSCIAPRVGFGSMYRPNGSSSGRRALSRAFEFPAGNWGTTTPGAASSQCGVKKTAGMIELARSSSGPSSGDTGTDLVYVPFARDALSFAYYRPTGGAPVTSMSTAEINAIYATSTVTATTAGDLPTVDGIPILACGIQTGSGTYQSWLSMTSASATDNNAVDACKRVSTATDISDPDPVKNGRIQEHAGDQLQDKGDALAGTPFAGAQVIVGFSASNFIAQCNGTGLYRLGTTPDTATGVRMGTIDGLGSPIATGTGCPGNTTGTYSANATFYAGGLYGRSVYNVVPALIIDDFGFTELKEMLVDRTGSGGPDANLCTDAVQVETVLDHGYLLPTDCGSTTLRGSFMSGAS